MKKLIFILTLLFAFCVTENLSAQGRKREHRNQRKRSSGGSRGNGNAFAGGYSSKNSRPKGSRVTAGGWVYKPTNPGKKQNLEQRHLFTRYRTAGRKKKSGMQARINRERAKNRVHGSSSFGNRRY